MEEVGQPLSAIDPDDFEDRLMNDVVGNGIHVYQLLKRLFEHLPGILKQIEKLPKSGKGIYTI